MTTMFATVLLPASATLHAQICNGDLDQRAGMALSTSNRTVGVLRSTMPGLHAGTVRAVRVAPSHQCLLNHAESHAMLIASVRGNAFTKDVPLAVLAVPPPANDDATDVGLTSDDLQLHDAVAHATFASSSAFDRGELTVVPRRTGGWAWAVVVFAPESVAQFPCYLNRDVSHSQRILSVALLDLRGFWSGRRKR